MTTNLILHPRRQLNPQSCPRPHSKSTSFHHRHLIRITGNLTGIKYIHAILLKKYKQNVNQIKYLAAASRAFWLDVGSSNIDGLLGTSLNSRGSHADNGCTGQHYCTNIPPNAIHNHLPVFDLSRHGEESLFNVGSILGRCFQEWNIQALGKFVCSGKIDSLLVLHVRLVADQELVDAFAGVSVYFLKPGFYVFKSVCIGYIVDNNNTMRTTVVRRRDGAEALLTSSIPLCTEGMVRKSRAHIISLSILLHLQSATLRFCLLAQLFEFSRKAHG